MRSQLNIIRIFGMLYFFAFNQHKVSISVAILMINGNQRDYKF